MGKKSVQYYVPSKNRRKRKHYWWRYLLVFLLGQTLVLPGNLLLIGTAGTAATSMKLSTILQLAQQDPSKYLTEETMDSNIFQLIGQLTTKDEDGNSALDSINSLDQFIKVKDIINDLSAKINQPAISALLNEDLYSTKFTEMGEYFTTKLEVAPILESAGLGDKLSMLDFLLYKTPVVSLYPVKSSLTLNVGESLDCSSESLKTASDLRVLPSEADNQDVTWTYEATEGCVEVDEENKKLNAVGDGVITLTATSAGDETISTTVTVTVGEGAPSKNLKRTKREGGEKPGDEGEGGGDHGEETPTCNHVDEYAVVTIDEVETTIPNVKDGHCDICGELIVKKAKVIKELMDFDLNKLMSSFTVGKIMGLVQPGSTKPESGMLNLLWDKGIGELLDFDSLLSSFTIGSIMETVQPGTVRPEEGILNLLWDKGIDQIADFDALLKGAKLGDLLPASMLSAPPFSALSDFYIALTEEQEAMDPKPHTLDDAMDVLKLEDIMTDITEDSPLYGLRDKPISSLSDEIQEMKFSDLIKDAGGNKMLQKILDYGSHEGENALTLGNLAEEMPNVLQTFTIADAMNQTTEEMDNPLLKKLSEYSLGNIDQAFDDLTLADVLGDAVDSNPILSKIANEKITGNGLTDALNNLKLGDIVLKEGETKTGNDILDSLLDCYVMGTHTDGKTFQDGISDLTIMTVVGENKIIEYDVDGEGPVTDEEDYNYLKSTFGQLYLDEDLTTEADSFVSGSTYYYQIKFGYADISDESEFNSAIQAGDKIYVDPECTTLATTYEEGAVYYLDGAKLGGIWSLMFDSVDEARAKPLTDIGDLFTKLGDSILTKSLNTLNELELLKLDGGTDLGSPLVMTVSIPWTDIDANLATAKAEADPSDTAFTYTVRLDSEGYKAVGNTYLSAVLTAGPGNPVYIKSNGEYVKVTEDQGKQTYYIDKNLGDYSLTDIINLLAKLGSN